MNMNQLIRDHLEKSIHTKQKVLESCMPQIETAGQIVSDGLADGKKLLLCGNGGSAADAQHIAAELLIRYRAEPRRRSLPAISLASDSSSITAGANDLGFEDVYSRQVEGLGREGDVLLGITTSGNSENILRAFQSAKNLGMKNVLFTGKTGGKILQEHGDLIDASVCVPEQTTAYIQESHIAIGHILCRIIEYRLFQFE